MYEYGGHDANIIFFLEGGCLTFIGSMYWESIGWFDIEGEKLGEDKVDEDQVGEWKKEYRELKEEENHELLGCWGNGELLEDLPEPFPPDESDTTSAESEIWTEEEDEEESGDEW